MSEPYIVIDCGSSETKAGIAGVDVDPSCVIPTMVGIPKYPSMASYNSNA